MVATAAKKPRATKTVDSIISGRDRRAGLAYKLAAGSLAIDIEQPDIKTVKLDGDVMKATAIISTPTVDRVGDVLIPAGGRFANYKKNPSVLWNHGFGFDLPIGRSDDDNGNLLIRVNDDFVEADCFFAKSLKEAEQIFRLIEEKIVRATSVRETPIITSYKNLPGVGDVLIVEEWELEEWSWVPVGCNPDAIRKMIDSNRIAGMSIAEPILKSLLPFAPELKRFGVGFVEAPKERDMKLSPAFLKSLPLPMLTALKSDNPDDATVDAEIKSRAKSVDGSETEDTADEDKPADAPYGAQLLSAFYSAVAGAVANAENGMGPLENPEVKEGLTAILGSLKEHCTAMEGLHSTVYSSLPALKMESAEGEQDAEESLKSFLAAARVPQFQIQGLGVQLKSLAAAKNLNAHQRGLIGSVCTGLAKIVSQAKAAVKKPEQPADSTKADEDPEKLAALQKQMNDFKASMSA